jgi:hypothetical protein
MVFVICSSETIVVETIWTIRGAEISTVAERLSLSITFGVL